MGAVDDAKKYLSLRPPMENKTIFALHPDVLVAGLLDEIERLREEISELKYKEAYASRAYMAARRMLDERGIHMDYFLSRANYESEVKDKNNGWIPQ